MAFNPHSTMADKAAADDSNAKNQVVSALASVKNSAIRLFNQAKSKVFDDDNKKSPSRPPMYGGRRRRRSQKRVRKV